MRNLKNDHPWLYELYTAKNLHAVQRSDYVLNGLWSDLTIEQVLMASMKSQGGLTHGRGATESVRTQWVYTMHHRAAIHDALCTLTGKTRTTSEQHVELGKTRRQRDEADLEKTIEWLNETTLSK